MNVRDILSQQEAPASPTASESSDASARRGWVAPFLLHLHQMLRRENPRVIRWAEDGAAFEILDKEALTHQILPRYFKNKNFASFQRQLNYFGFRKWSKARSQFPTYSREHFTRDDYDAMALVKRQSKKSRKRKASTASDEQPEAKRLAAVQQNYWMASDKCKPILPRPDAAVEEVAPAQQLSVASPVWMPVSTPMHAPVASLPSLASISPIRKASTPASMAFKLPSIHELPSLSSGFASIGVIRPRLLA